MTQNTNTVEGSDSGAQFVTDFNTIIQNIHTFHKGPTVPSYAVTGMIWIDDSTAPIWTIKLYDGTDNIVIGTIDSFTNIFTPGGLPPQIITARGDIIRGDNSGNPERLSIGTNGQVLTSNGNDALWQNLPSTDPITTRGDIIRGNNSGNAERLAIGSNGQVLTSNGSDALWQNLPPSASVPQNFQLFTSSGTFNGNGSTVIVEVWGGGGGGGSSSSGNNGNTSSFGSHCSATGGTGGGGRNQPGGNGGTGIGGTINLKGSDGQGGEQNGDVPSYAGVGGNAPRGGGGGRPTSSNNGNNGGNYGGGGGGVGGSSDGSGSAGAGGGGGGGYAFKIITNLSGSVSVTVGSGGGGNFSAGDGSPGAVLVMW